MHKDGEEKRCSQGGTDEDQRHGIIKICYNRVNTVVHGEIRQLLLPEKTNSSFQTWICIIMAKTFFMALLPFMIYHIFSPIDGSF